jgi:hypothetical protein
MTVTISETQLVEAIAKLKEYNSTESQIHLSTNNDTYGDSVNELKFYSKDYDRVVAFEWHKQYQKWVM